MKVKKLVAEYGPLMAFVLLVIVYAIWQPNLFFNIENWKNILNQNASVGIMAIGMTLVIIGGGIDLSIGSMMAFTAALGLLVMNKQIGNSASEGTAVVMGCLVTIASAGLLGLFNGAIITLGKVAPFIATLVGLVAYRSIALSLADGGEIRSQSANIFPAIGTGGLPIPFIHLGNDRILVINWAILAFFGLALVAGFMLNKTRYGRRLIAVGANEKAAKYSAVSITQIKLMTYGFMGLLVGIAAVLSAARFNSVTSSQMGLYTELDAIAAAVIGGTRMSGGKGKIWGTVVGVLMLGLITNMLMTSGISNYLQGLVKGIIVLLAVLIQRGQGEE